MSFSIIQTFSFTYDRHLHGLSLRWHLGRKTGEVLRVMDGGFGSVHHILRSVIFSFLPVIVDTVVALSFLINSFDKWFGLIYFSSVLLYIGK